MFTLLNRGAAFFSHGIGARFLQSCQCCSDNQSLPPKACCMDFFEIAVNALVERWSFMPLGEREMFQIGLNLALVMLGSGSL